MFIYHITTGADWQKAIDKGSYAAPSLQEEGFIHLSKAEQVEGVLQRYYTGVKDLVKLTVDPTRLEHPLRYELAPSLNEEFPHVYGPLNLDAVVKVEKLDR